MKINSWDISNARAKQWNVTKGHNSLSNPSEWGAGALSPVLLDSRIGFQSWSIVLLVYGTSREDIQRNASLILSKMLGPVDIELDGFSRKFYGYLKTHSVEESSKKRFHRLTLNLDGYEYSAQMTVSGKSSISVSNPGTLPTPCILTISPTQAAGQITVSGLYTGSVKVTNVTSGTPIVIDGETGIITEGGRLREYDFWKLPAVKPGSSTLTVSSSFATVSVSFKPRYM